MERDVEQMKGKGKMRKILSGWRLFVRAGRVMLGLD
jgi:hypothetical protein